MSDTDVKITIEGQDVLAVGMATHVIKKSLKEQYKNVAVVDEQGISIQTSIANATIYELMAEAAPHLFEAAVTIEQKLALDTKPESEIYGGNVSQFPQRKPLTADELHHRFHDFFSTLPRGDTKIAMLTLDESGMNMSASRHDAPYFQGMPQYRKPRAPVVPLRTESPKKPNLVDMLIEGLKESLEQAETVKTEDDPT